MPGPEKQIITELNVDQLKALQTSMSKDVLIIKFGADWCGPCKTINPSYQTFIKNSPPNIIFADIDVDENLDLYLALKKQKMVSGIPAFLAFFAREKRDAWFIPDDSVVGADAVAVANFFKRCEKKAMELFILPEGYTYFS
jgi:thiol-disulfide isomerase/thioredoxin